MDKKQLKKWIDDGYPKGRLSDDAVVGLHLKKNPSSVSWRLMYRDESGNQRNLTIGRYPSLTLEMARKTAKAKYAEIVQGQDPLKERAERKQSKLNTALAYLDEFYRIKLQGNKSGHETDLMIRRHFADILKIPMAEITPRDITKWQSIMHGKKLAYATQLRALGAFQTLLNHAVKNGYLKQNTIKGVGLDKIVETEDKLIEKKKKRTYLDKTQIKQLMAGLDAYQDEKRTQRRNSRSHGKSHLEDLDAVHYVDHVKPFVLIMFYTGFRNGDVRTLRWEHINFSRFGSTIHKTISKTQHKDASAKTFPIPKELELVLKEWNKQQGSPTTGYLFINPLSGKPFDKQLMKRPWKRIKELAGLPEELDLYSLRHNFASWLVMNGTDLLTVAKLTGHKDIKMIVEHYGHLQPKTMEKAVSDSFASMFSDDTDSRSKIVKDEK